MVPGRPEKLWHRYLPSTSQLALGHHTFQTQCGDRVCRWQLPLTCAAVRPGVCRCWRALRAAACPRVTVRGRREQGITYVLLLRRGPRVPCRPLQFYQSPTLQFVSCALHTVVSKEGSTTGTIRRKPGRHPWERCPARRRLTFLTAVECVHTPSLPRRLFTAPPPHQPRCCPRSHLTMATPGEAPAAGPPAAASSTPGEERNLAVVKEYMRLAYDPARASADAVRHLVAEGSEFIAPTAFPEVGGSSGRERRARIRSRAAGAVGSVGEGGFGAGHQSCAAAASVAYRPACSAAPPSHAATAFVPCRPQVKDCLQYAEDHGKLMKAGAPCGVALACAARHTQCCRLLCYRLLQPSAADSSHCAASHHGSPSDNPDVPPAAVATALPRSRRPVPHLV